MITGPEIPAEEIREVLFVHPWFAGLDAGLVRALLASGRPRRLIDGLPVYHQGDADDGLYAVVRGRVRLTSYSAEGASHLLVIAGPGDWFGIISTLDGGPRQHEAVAQGDGLVLHFPRAAVEELGRANGSFWRAMCELAAFQIRLALGHVRTLISVPPDERILASLAVLQNRTPSVPLTLTHEEVAANVGMSRQTVSAALGRLQKRGLVTLGYRSIAVKAGTPPDASSAGEA